MTHVFKHLGLGLVGSGVVLAALLLIPIPVDHPPEKEKPVVKGKIEDPQKKEEEKRAKLEEELKKRLEEERKKIEEEKHKLEEERKLAELETERRKVEAERAEIQDQRRRLEEERLRLERERAEAPRPPTPEELRRMIEEAMAKQPPPPPPPPEVVPDLKPEPAPELPPADVENPPSKRKGGFFIYVDVPRSAPLDTLRRNGFALAVADSDGFITHVIRLDAGNRVLGYKEFSRDDRSVYGDVMFRLRDPRRIEGLASIDRAVGQAYEGSTLKLLILRTTYNQTVVPLIQQGQRFAERHKLDFDGIRLAIDEAPAWEGIYSKGKFYRKP
jgi:hypothetical protein